MFIYWCVTGVFPFLSLPGYQSPRPSHTLSLPYTTRFMRRLGGEDVALARPGGRNKGPGYFLKIMWLLSVGSSFNPYLDDIISCRILLPLTHRMLQQRRVNWCMRLQSYPKSNKNINKFVIICSLWEILRW